eukprot:8039633-Pyramimonas_sp.AAC.1
MCIRDSAPARPVPPRRATSRPLASSRSGCALPRCGCTPGPATREAYDTPAERNPDGRRARSSPTYA